MSEASDIRRETFDRCAHLSGGTPSGDVTGSPVHGVGPKKQSCDQRKNSKAEESKSGIDVATKAEHTRHTTRTQRLIPDEWYTKYPEIFQRKVSCDMETPGGETTGGNAAAVFEEEDENESDVCPICLDVYDDENPSEETQCNHFFHLQCCLEWKQRSNECPCCYGPLRLKNEQLMADLGWTDATPQRPSANDQQQQQRRRNHSHSDAAMIQEQQLLILIARMRSITGGNDTLGGRPRSHTTANVPQRQQPSRQTARRSTSTTTSSTSSSSSSSGGWLSKLINFFTASPASSSAANTATQRQQQQQQSQRTHRQQQQQQPRR